MATFCARGRYVLDTGQLVLEYLPFWARYRHYGAHSRSRRVGHVRERYRVTQDGCKTKG
jgi:hypothetical protein